MFRLLKKCLRDWIEAFDIHRQSIKHKSDDDSSTILSSSTFNSQKQEIIIMAYDPFAVVSYREPGEIRSLLGLDIFSQLIMRYGATEMTWMPHLVTAISHISQTPDKPTRDYYIDCLSLPRNPAIKIEYPILLRNGPDDVYSTKPTNPVKRFFLGRRGGDDHFVYILEEFKEQLKKMPYSLLNGEGMPSFGTKCRQIYNAHPRRVGPELTYQDTIDEGSQAVISVAVAPFPRALPSDGVEEEKD